MMIETPELRKPFVVDVETNTLTNGPTYLWNIEEIIKQNVNSDVMVTGIYGFKGEEMKSIKLNLHAIRSEKLKKYIQESPEYEMCQNDESKGRLLTSSCKKPRHLSDSLDQVYGKLSLPVEIVENKVTDITSEIAKVVLMPYLTPKSIEQRVTGKHIEYEVVVRVNATGELLFSKIDGNGEQVELNNVRLGKYFTKLLPMCTRKSIPTLILQKLTTFSTPSSCVIESGIVETFDNMTYTYPLNDCEHVVFAELSTRPRVLISTKKTAQIQHVKMIVDGHKFEVELKKGTRYSRESKVIIRINGEPKELVSTINHNNTIITKYLDGVVAIYSKMYGIEVRADSERLEVHSDPVIFRNRATGLCGDLNGEWNADLKSPKQCIMPVPKMTAFTFMIEDGKCKGIPKQIKPELKKLEQICIEKEDIPTRVTEVFNTHTILGSRSGETELKHIFEELGEKICFSKELVRVCYKTFPREVFPKKMPFTCISGSKAKIIKKRVIAGEQIEELQHLPTEFLQTVYEPKRC